MPRNRRPAAQRPTTSRCSVTSSCPPPSGGRRCGPRLRRFGPAGRNLAEGWGGPSERSVLYDPDEVLDRADGLPVTVLQSGIRERPVETDDGERVALDTVVVLRREG